MPSFDAVAEAAASVAAAVDGPSVERRHAVDAVAAKLPMPFFAIKAMKSGNNYHCYYFL